MKKIKKKNEGKTEKKTSHNNLPAPTLTCTPPPNKIMEIRL